MTDQYNTGWLTAWVEKRELKCAGPLAAPQAAPPSTRRFCACGQEVFGRQIIQDAKHQFCGDCTEARGPRESAPLDRRIREAQHEPDDVAWMTPATEWP